MSGRWLARVNGPAIVSTPFESLVQFCKARCRKADVDGFAPIPPEVGLMILRTTLLSGNRILLLLCLMLAFALAPGNGYAANQPTPLTQADVLRLLKAKLPDAALVQRVNHDRIAFATTKDAIAELRAAGASRAVL